MLPSRSAGKPSRTHVPQRRLQAPRAQGGSNIIVETINAIPNARQPPESAWLRARAYSSPTHHGCALVSCEGCKWARWLLRSTKGVVRGRMGHLTDSLLPGSSSYLLHAVGHAAVHGPYNRSALRPDRALSLVGALALTGQVGCHTCVLLQPRLPCSGRLSASSSPREQERSQAGVPNHDCPQTPSSNRDR